jgi:hypothetical protein
VSRCYAHHFLSPCLDNADEVLARAANLLTGRAAFERARRVYPLEYRRGAQVLERSTGGECAREQCPLICGASRIGLRMLY